jgi:hypothetical protein
MILIFAKKGIYSGKDNYSTVFNPFTLNKNQLKPIDYKGIWPKLFQNYFSHNVINT